jgi:hypothetical protein
MTGISANVMCGQEGMYGTSAFKVILDMDKMIKLKKPENINQVNDWETWCPGAEIGKEIDTPLNPVLS